MTNDFGHLELNTSNLKEATSFYTTLFEWKTEDMTMESGGKYTFIKQDKGTSGGMLEMPGDFPPVWLVYITVASIDEYVKKALDLGGKQRMPKTEIPGMGWYAVLSDPQGAAFAIWENMPK